MLKKLSIFFTFATLTCGSLFAADPIGKGLTIQNRPLTDTTAKKDSVVKELNPLVDPKEGFKNLYIPEETEAGISMAQLNPLAIGFVEDYMDSHGKLMEDMKITGKPYFDMMDDVLTRHGLPKELKYLAVIESFLKTNARSWAGAVGPWQFMPATARNMGLQVNRKIDERRDLVKSTHAASKYLNSLFNLYGDWLLVIAAYNSGPGTVNSAIKRSGSKDFWQLQRFLPLESRNHVKKFIATHYIMEGVGGITTVTKKEAGTLIVTDKPIVDRVLVANAKTQSISGRYNSIVIAKYISMDIAEFHKFNPQFDKFVAENSKYELYLPADKMEIFVAKKFDILGESVQLLLNPDAAVLKATAKE